MYGYIYLTENLINHKKYIGQHKSNKFDENYKGSGVLLRRAIEKYGWENFTCTIIKECTTRDELNLAEIEFIETYNAINDPAFYNIAKGGEGGDTVTGMILEDKIKFAQESSDAWKISGRYAERCRKISSALKNKLKSDEHRKNLSESRIRNGSAAGENNPMYGKCRAGELSPNFGRHYYNNGVEEYLLYENVYERDYKSKGFIKGRLQHKLDVLHEDLSKRLQGNTYNRGKIRVHKDNLEKCIKPEDLDKFLADGWIKGRRPK